MEKRLVLEFPSVERKEDILEYKKEFLENEEILHGTAGLQNEESYEVWYQAVVDNGSEDTVREGLVPSTTYLGVEKETGKIVGFIDIRHRLNEYLLQYGGHIGYSVRKSERRKGYAAEMLKLALEECRKMKIDKVLVTCDRGNIGSEKTILKNGGVFENEVPEEGHFTRRFWITL